MDMRRGARTALVVTTLVVGLGVSGGTAADPATCAALSDAAAAAVPACAGLGYARAAVSAVLWARHAAGASLFGPPPPGAHN